MTEYHGHAENSIPRGRGINIVAVEVCHFEYYVLKYCIEAFVTKWIKSYLLPCFGTFKMPILMFISVLVFRPEGQI